MSAPRTRLFETRPLRDRWLALAPLAVAAMLAMAPPTDDGPTLCPFALITGVACPGCGMSRALGWLVRGDVGEALRYHPLAPLVAVVTVVGLVWLTMARWGRWRPPGQKAVNLGLIAVGFLLVGVWVIRLATGTLPPV